MEELLKEKLEAVITLRNFTIKIMPVSLKSGYDEFNSMVDERQKYIENLDIINKKINDSVGISFTVSNEVKALKKEIREIIKEIITMDNTLRKNLQNVLNTLKANLNQEIKSSKTLNIKA